METNSGKMFQYGYAMTNYLPKKESIDITYIYMYITMENGMDAQMQALIPKKGVQPHQVQDLPAVPPHQKGQNPHRKNVMYVTVLRSAIIAMEVERVVHLC